MVNISMELERNTNILKFYFGDGFIFQDIKQFPLHFRTTEVFLKQNTDVLDRILFVWHQYKLKTVSIRN